MADGRGWRGTAQGTRKRPKTYITGHRVVANRAASRLYSKSRYVCETPGDQCDMRSWLAAREPWRYPIRICGAPNGSLGEIAWLPDGRILYPVHLQEW